jgi:hypothetical protein
MAGKYVHFRFNPTLIEHLDKEANATGRTRSDIVRSAVTTALSKPRRESLKT